MTFAEDPEGTGVIANPSWGPGTNLRPASSFHWTAEDSADESIDYDQWYTAIVLDKDLSYDYKFGGHIANLDGTYPVTGKTIYPVLTIKVTTETLPSVKMEASCNWSFFTSTKAAQII